MQTAARMLSLKPYFFAGLGARINELRAAGKDVIRLDMGSPDLPPAPFIVEAMKQSADQADHHGYQPFGGPAAFRQAVSDYYGKRFGVELDSAGEIVGLIGSKEGIFNVAQAYLNPGDVALVPDPGYPTYTAGALFAGAEIHYMPLLEKNNFLPDLAAIPADKLKRAKILWLNYPNNPTGAVATAEFFAEAVAFARRHDILLCHDAPYAEIGYDGYRPISLLQVPGAKDVAVEFNSLSKAYNMGGWRLGMAAGNAEAIKAIHTLKSNIDSATFLPIYDAGVAALTGDQSWLVERNAIYRERRDLVVEGLRAAG
ncbi:MAG: aminotransferase class I/II-fold pyridoxal phosphate-dependent enzyme, partial [Chloroflexi bacterium]|nr:aminotransferase class I/II-fold pyridoxal phosphate-dependent enzyme [Chloroflexota bacterium]